MRATPAMTGLVWSCGADRLRDRWVAAPDRANRPPIHEARKACTVGQSYRARLSLPPKAGQVRTWQAGRRNLKKFRTRDSAHMLRTGLYRSPRQHGPRCPHFAQGLIAIAAGFARSRKRNVWPGRVDNPREHRRTLRPVEGEPQFKGSDPQRTRRRICARRGCATPVKKATAKYCSVRCCAVDPERHARLRLSAQRSNRRVLPMTRQLRLGFNPATNPEAAISRISAGREDVPQGMSRLCS